MKQYRIEFEKKAIKSLASIDNKQATLLVAWIANNLEGTSNPRKYGRALKGRLKEYWRYHVGQYRIVVDIQNTMLVVVVVSLGHRKEIYAQ